MGINGIEGITTIVDNKKLLLKLKKEFYEKEAILLLLINLLINVIYINPLDDRTVVFTLS